MIPSTTRTPLPQGTPASQRSAAQHVTLRHAMPQPASTTQCSATRSATQPASTIRGGATQHASTTIRGGAAQHATVPSEHAVSSQSVAPSCQNVSRETSCCREKTFIDSINSYRVSASERNVSRETFHDGITYISTVSSKFFANACWIVIGALLAVVCAMVLANVATPSLAYADDANDTSTNTSTSTNASGSGATNTRSANNASGNTSDSNDTTNNSSASTTNTTTSSDTDDSNEVNPQQLPDSSFIYDTSISDLSTADTYYDNQTVQVVGEVIGDNIAASLDGRHRWITLANEDGSATISVYMSSESAARIDHFGQYGVTGTTLQVRGTFHLVCDEHEGVTDLHAEVVSVVSPGSDNPDEFVFEEFIPGLIAVAAGLIMLAVFYLLRERQR